MPFGLPLTEDQWLYYFCLIVMVLLFWAAANMLNSRSGLQSQEAGESFRDPSGGRRSFSLSDGIFLPGP